MDPILRLAGPDDVDVLLGFMKRLYEQDKTPFDESGARRALDGMVRDRTLGRVWMIGDGRETFGYVALTLGYSLEWHGRDAFVDELYIDAGRRRQGYGAGAMRLVEQACRELGVHALHLEAERGNAAARELYRRCGFVDRDRCLMTKLLER